MLILKVKLKYKYIDSIRGIAILLVILVHTGRSVIGLDSYLEYLVLYGQMGVQLFFIASAFTLCLSTQSRVEEKNFLFNFYTRRFFRIAPAYFLIGILGYFILRTLMLYLKTGIWVVPEIYTIPNVLSNLFFYHGLNVYGNNLVPGGWSIGTEMLFYLIFPFTFFFLKKKLNSIPRIMIFPLVVFIVSQVIIFYYQGIMVYNNSFIYFNILNQAPVFSCGISLYFLHKYKILESIPTYVFILAFIVFSLLAIYFGWGISRERSFYFGLVPFLSSISFIGLVAFDSAALFSS
jgi:peptidoglycan/LPS O-acetylase OafA/YrhL